MLGSREKKAWREAESESMARLCEEFARPLQILVARRRGCAPVEAEETVQRFIGSAMTDGWIEDEIAPEAHLRSFLPGRIARWLRKRENEAAGEETCESFECEWAWVVLGRAMQQVREVYEKRRRLPEFEALRGVLPGGGGSLAYAKIAGDFGATEVEMREAGEALHVICAEFLRTEVARTVADPGLVDEEMRYLISLVQRE